VPIFLGQNHSSPSLAMDVGMYLSQVLLSNDPSPSHRSLSVSFR
jgi:hypothetical protein